MKKANHHFRSSGASPKFHQHRNILCSEAIKTMADITHCYWLLELIEFYQSKGEMRHQKFQCWELLRASDSTFDLIATDSHNHILVAHQIAFTNFPYDAATLWIVNRCLIFPNEFVNCHTRPSPVIPASLAQHSSLN